MPVKVPANKSGLPFGSFILTGAGFPARVAGASNAQRTFAEVYGLYQEMGDVYTNANPEPFGDNGCKIITKEAFVLACNRRGHDPTKANCSKLTQWDAEQGTWDA